MAASSTSSALRVAIDPVKVLNLGGVWLKARLAFFAVGFGVGGGGPGSNAPAAVANKPVMPARSN
jgi:hypothetical protein